MNFKMQSLKDAVPYFIIVLLLHIIGIAFIITGAKDNTILTGMAFVAYLLGLRHAFDPDHIAAIDNTVRKLLQQGKNALGVGFYFSLGHSSVVFLMSVVIGISASFASRNLPYLQHIGGIIGMTVSGLFLVTIGILNLILLIELIKIFKQLKTSYVNDEKLEEILVSRGLISRFIGPLYKMVNKAWHLYPLGFLFGLGFDTASEVALLSLSATASTADFNILGILALPILFAAGMSLMDTADGVFMTKAYDWAFTKPVRKLYYNITITLISVLAALVIGMVELFQVVSDQLNLHGSFWTSVNNITLDNMGYALVALFAVAWLISYIIWKTFKIEE